MMTKMKLKNKGLILLFLIGASNVWSQNFDYQTTVEPTTTKGFQRIELSAEILGKLNNSKSDIRLYSDKGEEIPYIFQQEKATATYSLFKEYTVIDRQNYSDSLSVFVFENRERKKIDNFSLSVQNTEVRKRARLSGSNDQENWYVIKNDYLLHSLHSSKELSEMKILNFPLSDYAFLKLEIDDKESLPIHIQKIGFYDYESVSGNINQFGVPIASQKDSNHISYIHLLNTENMYAEKLEFFVSGADYYQRYATLFEKKTRITKRKKEQIYFEAIGSFNLNSNSTNTINLRGIEFTDLYVEIDNIDDQPLHVDSVSGIFLKHYLVADLDPQQTYTLKFGDEKIGPPRYDLVNFTKNIPKNLPVIQSESIISLKSKSTKKTTSGIFENAYTIWIVLGFVGLILGYVSFKMIKEIGDKKED